jgi:hypothetical protein
MSLTLVDLVLILYLGSPGVPPLKQVHPDSNSPLCVVAKRSQGTETARGVVGATSPSPEY